MGNSLKLFYWVAAVQVLSTSCAENNVSIMLGVAGGGKSSILNSLCNVQLKTGRSMHAVTMEEYKVDCGDQIIYDSVGLHHLEKNKPMEDAYHDGLERLLSFLDKKEFGKFYIVLSTADARDHARFVEQLRFLKEMLPPIIPWILVFNCYNGDCPSTSTQPRAEIWDEVLSMCDESIEVSNPHLQPVDRSLFPPPETAFRVDLPENWREDIAQYKISKIKEQMKDKAVAQCAEHQAAFLAASETVRGHQCTRPACEEISCDSLPKCKDVTTCTVPNNCKNSDSCRTRKKVWDCSFVPPACKSVKQDIIDTACINALTNCNSEWASACNSELREVSDCNAARSTECLKHKKSYMDCNTQHIEDCAVELSSVEAASRVIIEKHEPYVAQCHKFYTMSTRTS